MTTLSQPWLPPPASPVLSSEDVHVWQATLNQPADIVDRLAATLSNDERQRAERFHFERDRRRFTAGRGILRVILGRYLNLEPDRLRFSYGAQGKPYLAQPAGNPPLSFNLTHSHELALYAFTLGREVGIDVEYIKPLPDLEQIAGRFFSAQEQAQLLALPPAQKAAGFFNCWTRKEAYIKALGQGLSIPLDAFDVSLIPGQPAALLKVKTDPRESRRWTLKALTPAPGYIAAVAAQGQHWQLRCWQWPASQ